MARTPLICVPLLLVAAGCGTATVASEPDRAAQSLTDVRSCASGSYRRLGSRRGALAAVVRRHATVVRRPGGKPLASFGEENANGVATVFSVLGARVDRRCRPLLYRVQVPLRPNGVTGWVTPGAVAVVTVRTRILVDLSDRRLTLYRGGKPVLASRVAVGAPSTPTPTGRYYVNQRLIPADRTGPFGPGAIGISAFSEVLTGWAQGGPIAIHGTNAPWSIGKSVSNGCLRLRNDALRRVFEQALAGTPVVIRS